MHTTLKMVSYVTDSNPEEVVQVYRICIRMLHFLVISVMIIEVMRLSYNGTSEDFQKVQKHIFNLVQVQSFDSTLRS